MARLDPVDGGRHITEAEVLLPWWGKLVHRILSAEATQRGGERDHDDQDQLKPPLRPLPARLAGRAPEPARSATGRAGHVAAAAPGSPAASGLPGPRLASSGCRPQGEGAGRSRRFAPPSDRRSPHGLGAPGRHPPRPPPGTPEKAGLGREALWNSYSLEAGTLVCELSRRWPAFEEPTSYATEQGVSVEGTYPGPPGKPFSQYSGNRLAADGRQARDWE